MWLRLTSELQTSNHNMHILRVYLHWNRFPFRRQITNKRTNEQHVTRHQCTNTAQSARARARDLSRQLYLHTSYTVARTSFGQRAGMHVRGPQKTQTNITYARNIQTQRPNENTIRHTDTNTNETTKTRACSIQSQQRNSRWRLRRSTT